MRVRQSSIEPKPANRESSLPVIKPVHSPTTSRAGSRPIATATSLKSATESRRSPASPLNLIQNLTFGYPESRSNTAAPTTPTGRVSSPVKELRLPSLSDSADLEWKPNSVCADSVLSYATNKMAPSWSENEYVSLPDCVYRATKAEREGVFRANGILMGVRFVVGVRCDESGGEVGMKE
jgi:hypothetical protein